MSSLLAWVRTVRGTLELPVISALRANLVPDSMGWAAQADGTCIALPASAMR